MESVRAQCLQAGMNDFLTKPLMLPELAERMTRFVKTPTRGGGADAGRQHLQGSAGQLRQ